MNMMHQKNRLFDYLNLLFTTLVAVACLVPMVVVLSTSFTDEAAIQKYGYNIIPRVFSLSAYKLVFANNGQILNSYLVTIFITVVGGLLAVVITAMAAYALVNKRVHYRNAWALYFFVTMVFSAGLVPWYIMCTTLGMRDNLLALIVPGMVFSPFNMFLTRNYMKGIPESLMESATIDGANDAHIAFRIYLPLCLPVLATVSLFYALNYWNNWFNAIMLVENQKIFPLQYLLFQLKSEISMLTKLQQGAGSGITLPGESLKMATAIITIGPIVLLYPRLQKYFVKGLIVGSVKG
jgi:putative aldouronate transport system permease protein